MIRRAPWLILAAAAGIASVGYALMLLNTPAYELSSRAAAFVFAAEQTAYFLIFFVGWALVGALIASRRPENAVGWLLLGGSTMVGIAFAADQYAVYTAVTAPGTLPRVALLGWPSFWMWVPGVMLLTVLMPLVFPTGRPPSPRWRPAVWAVAAAIAFSSGMTAVTPAAHWRFPQIRNEFALLPEAWVGVTDSLFGVLFLASIGVVLLSLVVRFRGAGRAERQQLKWFLWAVVIAAVGAVAPAFGSGPVVDILESVVLPIGFGAVPASIAIAILRHRLFDIDLVIRRTLVYGGLTAMLAVVYVGGVLLLSQLLGGFAGGDQLAIAASTLGAAALFRPLRERTQRAVDRRFYRSRYDAVRTVEAFGQRLRHELDLDSLNDELRTVVQQAIHPASVSVWLRRPEQQGR